MIIYSRFLVNVWRSVTASDWVLRLECDWVWRILTGCDSLWWLVTESVCDWVWQFVMTACDWVCRFVTACDWVWRFVTACDRVLYCVFICLCCVLQVCVVIFDCILCFTYLSCVLHICIVFCISVLCFVCMSVLCFVCLCCVLYVCVVFCTCGLPYLLVRTDTIAISISSRQYQIVYRRTCYLYVSIVSPSNCTGTLLLSVSRWLKSCCVYLYQLSSSFHAFAPRYASECSSCVLSVINWSESSMHVELHPSRSIYPYPTPNKKIRSEPYPFPQYTKNFKKSKKTINIAMKKLN